MKSSSLLSKMIKFSVLILLIILLPACGSSAEENQSEEILQEDVLIESSAEDSQSEEQTNTTGATFEEQELPENFPEEFPLPEYAKVGSTVDVPGENSYRIFFAFPEISLEEALAFYRQELQAGGWSVDAEGPEATGYGMWITHPEYEAKLDFIVDEYGVVLDLALAPLGELEELPGSADVFGDSEGLGESVGDFPADFPVPSKFTAIDLPAKLAEEGYQLAFNFTNMAELAIVELSSALITASWEIGEFEIDPMTGSYMVPFTGPGGFQGYALITAKAEVAGLSSINGCVIAMHTGEIQ